MRKLKEVLRLRYELKLGYQQIGRSCAIAVSTVHKYLKRAEKAGVSWPLPEDWDEARVEAVLFPEAVAPSPPTPQARALPDFAAIHEELKQHRGLTLLQLWVEYAEGASDFRLRRVEPSGTKSAPVTIAPVSGGRASGYPRMARRGDELILAWTDSGPGEDGALQVQTAVAELP